MNITERRTIRADVDITVDSKVLAHEGAYMLVERLDKRAIQFAVLRSFGEGSNVTVAEYAALIPAEQKFRSITAIPAGWQ